MSLATLLGTPCTITHRTSLVGSLDPFAQPTYDLDGNEIPSEASTTETVCSLQQTQRSEPSDEGEFSSTTWTVFLPTGTPIATADKVTVGGADYEVVGDPWDATEGSSAVHHVEATVKKTG